MKISKTYIAAVFLLLAASAGAWATYEFYVKERLRELGEHQMRAKALENKIRQMDQTFHGTKPPLMLSEWAGKAQPWEEAVTRRSRFFSMGDAVLAVNIPEGEIPKFYYQREYPKRRDNLSQLAFTNNVQFPINFGVPTAQSLANQNPTRQEVQEWLTRIETYSDIARLLINANAQQIVDINMWPPRPGPVGKSGSVEYRTYGLQFTMTMQNFVRFLERLATEQRYFNVDHFFVHNKTLRNPNAPLQIQMLLTQARYLPAQEGGGPGGPGAVPQLDTRAAFAGGGGFGGGANVFAGGGGAFGGDDRRAQPKPGIMRRILNLFPF